MKKYTIHYKGKKKIFAQDLLDAAESGKKEISYTHPSMNLEIESITFDVKEEE